MSATRMSEDSSGSSVPERPRRTALRWLFAACAALAFSGALELTARIFLPRASIPVLLAPLENAVN